MAPATQDVNGKRLIPFQATDDFIEKLDAAVEVVRGKEEEEMGEAFTDRSKFIRAALREKIASLVTEPEAA
jgi:hypothetical protein